MTTTIDDFIRAGRRHALGVLDMIAAEHGDQASLAFAGGFAGGARNFVLSKSGPRAAYDLLQAMADDVITPELGTTPQELRNNPKAAS